MILKSPRLVFILRACLFIALGSTLALIIASPLRANWDFALYLDVGRDVLAGQRPYVDYFESNLPVIHYVSAVYVWLSSVTGVSAIVAGHLSVWALTVVACLTSLWLARRLFKEAHILTIYAIPLAIALQSLSILHSNEYGQREQIFILFFIPGLLLRLLRWEDGQTPRAPVAFFIGMVAALGILIKPHFMLTLVVIEGYCLLRWRKIRPLLHPETAGFLMTCLVLVAYLVLNPDSLTGLIEIWSLAAQGYAAYADIAGFTWLQLPSVQLTLIIALIPFMIPLTDRQSAVHHLRIFALLMVSSLLIFVIQDRGFLYHMFPMFYGLNITGFLLLAEILTGTPDRISRRIVGGAVIGISGLILIQPLIGAASYAPLHSRYLGLIERYSQPNDAVLMLGTPATFAQPDLEQLNRHQASSYHMAYPLLMAYHDSPLSPLDVPQDFPPSVEQFMTVIAEDIAQRPPLIILDKLTRDFMKIHGFSAEYIFPHYAIVEQTTTHTALVKLPETQAATTYQFGDYFQLLDVTLSAESAVSACDIITVETLWESLAYTATDYSMTLVLTNSRGGITQIDSVPATIETHQWETGMHFIDTRSLTIPCDTPAGTYPLLIGLYDPTQANSNLPVIASDGAAYPEYLFLADIMVTAP